MSTQIAWQYSNRIESLLMLVAVDWCLWRLPTYLAGPPGSGLEKVTWWGLCEYLALNVVLVLGVDLMNDVVS